MRKGAGGEEGGPAWLCTYSSGERWAWIIQFIAYHSPDGVAIIIKQDQEFSQIRVVCLILSDYE